MPVMTAGGRTAAAAATAAGTAAGNAAAGCSADHLRIENRKLRLLSVSLDAELRRLQARCRRAEEEAADAKQRGGSGDGGDGSALRPTTEQPRRTPDNAPPPPPPAAAAAAPAGCSPLASPAPIVEAAVPSSSATAVVPAAMAGGACAAALVKAASLAPRRATRYVRLLGRRRDDCVGAAAAATDASSTTTASSAPAAAPTPLPLPPSPVHGAQAQQADEVGASARAADAAIADPPARRRSSSGSGGGGGGGGVLPAGALEHCLLAQAAYAADTAAELHAAVEEAAAEATAPSAAGPAEHTRAAAQRAARLRSLLQAASACTGRRYRVLRSSAVVSGSGAALGALWAAAAAAAAASSAGAAAGDTGLRAVVRGAAAAAPEFAAKTTPAWVVLRAGGGGDDDDGDDGSGGDVVVSIAGTQNKYDVFRDAMCVAVPAALPQAWVAERRRGDGDGGGRRVEETAACHEGFLKAAHEVFADVVGVVEAVRARAGRGGRPVAVSFCGHSMGGAVAVLLGAFFARLAPAGVEVSGVYTYGAPKVFTRGGDGFLRGVPVRAFVTDMDVVPRGVAGSSIAKTAARLLARLGLDRLRFVTPAAALCLPAYRFAGDELYVLGEAAADVAVHAGAAAAEAHLDFSLSLLRPRALAAHRAQEYLRRLHAAAAAAPLELAAAPFGEEEEGRRPLSEAAVVASELAFLEACGDAGAAAGVADALARAEKKACIPLVRGLLLVACGGGGGGGRPLLSLCAASADAAAAEARAAARRACDEAAAARQRAAREAAEAESEERLYGGHGADGEDGGGGGASAAPSLAYLNAVFRIAQGEGVRVGAAGDGEWRGLLRVYAVAKAASPGSVRACLDAHPTRHLNLLFKLLEGGGGGGGRDGGAEEEDATAARHPHVVTLWSVCFASCGHALRTFYAAAAERGSARRVRSRAAVVVQRFALRRLSVRALPAGGGGVSALPPCCERLLLRRPHAAVADGAARVLQRAARGGAGRAEVAAAAAAAASGAP